MRDLFVCQEKFCEKCGKSIVARDDWAFKRGTQEKPKYFCSWKCLRQWDNSHDNSSQKRQKRERIIQAIRDGLTTNEIVNLLNVERHNVIYWQKKLEGEKKNENIKSGDQDV